MTTKSFVKVFMRITNVILYLVVSYSMVRFLIKTGFARLPISDLIFIVLPGICLLWSVTYLGTWVSIAERKCEVFWKAFTFLDIVPGILGAIAAFAII